MAKLARKLAAQQARGLAAAINDELEPLYALTNFSASSYYATQAGGGESGDAAGFGLVLLWRVSSQSVASRFRILYDRWTSVPVGGWTITTTGTNTGFQASFVDGSGTSRGTASFALPASMVGQVLLVVVQHTGTSVRLIPLRGLPTADVAITGFTAAATPAALGVRVYDKSIPADGVDILAAGAWRGTPTLAQIERLYDDTRAQGGLPLAMEGATITHRWPDRAALKQLVAPAALEDTVTRAPVDAMARQGTPSVVTIDPSRDGRRLLGAQGFSAANYLQADAGKGIVGTPTALTVQAHLYAGSTVTGYFVATLSQPSGLVGYQFQLSNGNLAIALVNGAGTTVTASATGMGVNRPGVATATFDGITIRLYFDDAVVATQPCAGFIPGPNGMRVGDRLGPTSFPFSGAVYALQGGDYVATPAEIAACAAETARTGRLARMPGAQHYYDFTEDFLPTESVTATVQDRIGTDHLTRVGTGLTLAQRTERVWSWERSPILYGAGGLSDADFYESATGFEGSTQSWWFALAFILAQQAGLASGIRSLAGRTGARQGWEIRTSGTNSALTYVAQNATTGSAAFIAGPTSPIVAADVGKVLLYIAQYDSTTMRLRAFFKRAEVSAPGQSTSGYTPAPPDSVFRVGRHSSATGQGAGGIVILGGAYGAGSILSLPEVHALHDAVMATERMEAVPGKTDALIRFAADGSASGLTRVGSPSAHGVYSRAFGW
jgi:hypothetical protein